MVPESVQGRSAVSAATVEKKAKPEEVKRGEERAAAEESSQDSREAARNDRGVQTLTEA